MPPPELEPVPEGSRPEGSVIGNFSASTMEVDGGHTLEYHRPHAFALMHGDNGAKIAYGQLAWRIDVVTLGFGSTRAGVDEAGQDAIAAFNIKIPTIDSCSGKAMDPTIPNIYHQLDGYGDVYLYWTTKLDESDMEDRVDCWWVQVDTEKTAAPDENELDVVVTAATAFSRCPATVNATSGQLVGTYRVKLGTVNVDELVKQNHASDVYWSTVLLTRV